MRIVDRIALILVIIGSLNWASVGIFKYNFVHAIFGAASVPSRIVFILVGVAGLWCISLLFRDHSERN